MRRVFHPSTMATFAITGLLAATSLPALAQSGSRSSPPSGPGSPSSPSAGSGQRAAQQAPLALEGYCPVSILEMQKWVKGNPAHRAVYDGRTYLFANAQGKQMFDANPAKYVPALGGDCVVALVEMGRRVPGNIRHASFQGRRLYLFSNENAHKTFRAEPAKYADADLAYGGNCVVCRVGMQRTVPGKPELAVVHKGLRYLFPSAEQRNEFLANPAKYEVSATDAPPSRPGSQTQPPARGSSSRPSNASGSGSR